MITVLIGDIFRSRAQTLVNTVNCVGVMGKGIARQFKEQFPEMFADYEARCAGRGPARQTLPFQAIAAAVGAELSDQRPLAIRLQAFRHCSRSRTPGK